jgi:hypothetical protein
MGHPIIYIESKLSAVFPKHLVALVIKNVTSLPHGKWAENALFMPGLSGICY